MPGFTLCGVELSSPKVACAISRASASSSGVVELAQHVHPDLDVLALRLAHLTLRRRGQVAQVAVLDPDQVGLAEREVEVEVDQPVERGGGRCGSATTSVAPASSRVLIPTSSSTSSASLLGKCR